jgi:hypothetical protein
MNKRWFILIFVLIPRFLLSQAITDTIVIKNSGPELPLQRQIKPSNGNFLFNLSTVFYTSKDSRIDKFLGKYGYVQPGNIPIGLKFEIGIMPFGKRILYTLNAGTIISRQDIVTADISIGAYYRFIKTKNMWLLGGVAIGEHFDRVVLNGNLPPMLDSLAKKYNTMLSLHRTGFITEPAIKIFWYPFHLRKSQIGVFAGICYDFDFNSRWRVGYYPNSGSTFKNLRKPTNIGTIHEFGWVFNAGLSFCL